MSCRHLTTAFSGPCALLCFCSSGLSSVLFSNCSYIMHELLCIAFYEPILGKLSSKLGKDLKGHRHHTKSDQPMSMQYRHS